MLIAAVLVPLSAPAPAANGTASFTAAANPFAYAAEYRDPAWGGTYLRARWYLPQAPSFLGRDPMRRQLNRYGYGGGNPIMRVDPSGRSYRGFQRAVAHLGRGAGGHFARFFLSPLMGVLQLAANPRGFWHAVAHDRAEMDIFLAGGLVAELATSGAPIPFTNLVLPQTRFWARVGGETVLGASQALLASFDPGLHHFHAGRFIAGLEYIAGPEVVGRIGAGLGYQPFGLGEHDAIALANHSLDNDADALIFRVRSRMHLSRAIGSDRVGSWTTPWQEQLNLGAYHEGLLAVTRRDLLLNDFSGEVLVAQVPRSTLSIHEFFGHESAGDVSLQFVGKVENLDPVLFHGNPRNLPSDDVINAPIGEPRGYHPFTNNCHHHVASVLDSLGLR